MTNPRDDVKTTTVDPGRARHTSIRWKLIMAADEPWQGEVYPTRPSGKRLKFSSIEELVVAIAEQSGWRISDSPARGGQR